MNEMKIVNMQYKASLQVQGSNTTGGITIVITLDAAIFIHTIIIIIRCICYECRVAIVVKGKKGD